MDNNFVSARQIIVDKKFTSSIVEKLQFYRMIKCLFTALSFIAAITFCNTSVAQTGYVKFVKTNDTVPEWIPNAKYYVETYNPTNDTFRCIVAVIIDSTTATPVLDLNAGNRPVVVAPGQTKIDTFPLEIIDDHLYDPFERIAFKLVNLSNPSFLTADSFAYVYILDDDSFTISFIGAGKSIVEHDTTYLVRIALNGLVPGTTSVKVSLDLSNATKGKDFNFKDTTITIDAFSYDTFYVPVVIYDDTLVEANEQINLTLSDATNGAAIDIAAFTITIIDNDLKPSYVRETIFSGLKTYPNPAANFILVDGLNEIAEWQLMNVMGEVLLRETTTTYPAKIQLDALPSGMYFLSGKSGNDVVKRTVVKQ
jgi:hypothetical protein